MCNRFNSEMFRRMLVLLGVIFFACYIHTIQAQDTLRLSIEPNEYWWGGLSADAHLMPYSSSTSLQRDLLGNNYGNQAQPLLISSRGRYIWSPKPIAYRFEEGS